MTQQKYLEYNNILNDIHICYTWTVAVKPTTFIKFLPLFLFNSYLFLFNSYLVLLNS